MQTKISVEKHNESFLKVNSNDRGAYQNIIEHFTFRVPGYQFNPKFKNGFWDGKIKLLKNGLLYYGLAHELENVCLNNGWEFENNLSSYPNYTLEEAETFASTLNLKNLSVRDYQYEYFVQAIKERRATLLCPTAGGKTLISYLITRWAFQNGFKKGLFIVPTVNLVSQLYTDYKDYGMKVEGNIHQIYSGQEKSSQAPLICTTWQSIYNIDSSWFTQFDFVIGDEAHTTKAKSLKTIMENLINARMRIGMSGTLDGTLTHKMVIEGLFGKTFQAVKTKDLIEQGHVSDIKIKVILLKHHDLIRQQISKLKLPYDKEMAFLCQSKKRNAFICKLALSLSGNTMLFYQFVESHGKLLYEQLLEMNKDSSRKIFYIHGKINIEEREAIRLQVEQEENAIVVTSYGTNSMGSNYKKIHNMIFATGYKSLIKNLQSIGRGLRKAKDKQELILYDIGDNLSFQKGKTAAKNNHTLNHVIDRMNTYNNEGFAFKLLNVDLL